MPLRVKNTLTAQFIRFNKDKQYVVNFRHLGRPYTFGPFNSLMEAIKVRDEERARLFKTVKGVGLFEHFCDND